MNNKLTIDRILDFCDVPQLFIARDAFDTIYLCLLYDDEPSCLYTAIRISNSRLQSFLSGDEDLIFFARFDPVERQRTRIRVVCFIDGDELIKTAVNKKLHIGVFKFGARGNKTFRRAVN